VANARKEPDIDSDSRARQGDLIVGLVNLVDRNRLALVVLAASLAAGARHRARGASGSNAVRWLAQNARAVRHFLQSLSALRRCSPRAGYRALSRAGIALRLPAAPRDFSATVAVAPAAGFCSPGKMLRLMNVPARP